MQQLKQRYDLIIYLRIVCKKNEPRFGKLLLGNDWVVQKEIRVIVFGRNGQGSRCSTEVPAQINP